MDILEEFESLKKKLYDAALNPDIFKGELNTFSEWVKGTSGENYRAKGVNALLEYVTDREAHQTVRDAALEALREIGPLAPSFVYPLLSVCMNKEENLRFRWAVLDALQEIEPEKTAGLDVACPELYDRSVDPDNPPEEFDVSAERSRIARRQLRELNFIPLIGIVLGAAAIATLWLWHNNREYFWISVAVWSTAAAIALPYWFITARRCPKCRRHFARERLKAMTSYESMSRPIGSLGPGGSPVQTRTTVTIYKAKCRYCGHQWGVVG